ncbi:MAG: DUF1016 domain-containing protein [Endozoicomonadaceae bacterium]|nr:DUF1016 domain-containing protein [Endozoicomonadaceae bacterium]
MAVSEITKSTLFGNIKDVIEGSRFQLKQVVNHVMVATYWEIGRLIVVDEQDGDSRATYGSKILSSISTQLTSEFGKGFDASNLRNMRTFYTVFPIRDSLRHELSWTHYRSIIRIKNAEARNWYIEESIRESWSARALDRQIRLFVV